MAATTADDYRVQLDAFEGPLDLLLFLIRRAEVEVHDIPIAAIADQYLDFLSRTERIDIEAAGDFLVMAATLMEIKSRSLAPPSPLQGGDESEEGGGSGSRRGGADESGDPRADLIRQILEYKRFRDAADSLDRMRAEWESRYPTARAGLDREALDLARPPEDEPIDDASTVDLIEAFQRIIDTVDFNRIGEHTVVLDETPIEIHAEDILDALRRRGEEARAAGEEGGKGGEPRGLSFSAVFRDRTRAEAIGLFLALLELVRGQRLRVVQDSLQGEIELRLAPESPPAGPGAATPV